MSRLPVVSDEVIDQQSRWMKVPRSLKAKFRRVFKSNSRKEAIDMHCVSECQGFDPGYRQAIRDCTRQICPLWRFRPYKNDKKETGK